jgi:hypothetical protein
MESQSREFKEPAVVKGRPLITRIGGYTKIKLFPIEFSQELDHKWIESFKKSYEHLSRSRVEDVLFEPGLDDFDIAEWNPKEIPLKRMIFITLNDRSAAGESRIDPDPAQAIEWAKAAADRTNEAFRPKTAFGAEEIVLVVGREEITEAAILEPPL